MKTSLFLLIVLAVAGLMPSVAVLLVRWSYQRSWQQELVAYALRFPRGVDAGAVVAFLSGLAGIVAPRWERPFAARAVALEASATDRGIQHHLVVARPLAHVVLSALRAALPSVGVRLDEDYRVSEPSLAAGLALNDHGRSLATDRAEAIAKGVLASLQPLGPGERVVVQWTLAPLGPTAAATGAPAGSLVREVWDGLRGQATNRTVDGEAVKAARAKQLTPGFLAAGRIGVTASSGRARALVLRVLAAFHAGNAPGAHLYRRYLPSGRVGRALTRHRLPLLEWPCTLNAAELAGLVAFPIGAVALPGLALGGTRQLAPAADIPSAGRVVARATFPGAERPIALSVADSLRHLHVIGPTGSGKSTLLVDLICQDMSAGRGVVVLDPKGDLVRDVLDRVPEHRVGDVIVLDATDEERPVGLNLLAGSQEAPELVVDQIGSIFANLFRSGWGPRTDDILRAALLTLAGVPGQTLCEVPLILTDQGFRRRMVGHVSDLVLQQFWGWYEGLSDSERAQAIAPLSNKLRAILLRRRLRNVLGQAAPRLDLDDALATNKILLVPLAKGLLGEEAAALAGSLLVARVWQAVQRRAAVPANARPLTFAYIDEFQDYLRLPTGVADVLAQARGLGLALTLAHQHLGQLPSGLKEAVLANARSRVIFQSSATDARALAHELTPYLDANDLQGLGAYEVVATLSAGARVAPPVTAATILPPEPTGQAARARAASRERYGVDRATVEASIRARHEGPTNAVTTARRRARS
jgi:uncharacterized protein DUF87